jgi:hypothetical protein
MHQTPEFFVGDSNVIDVPNDLALSNPSTVHIDSFDMQLSYQTSRPLVNKNRLFGVGSVLGDTHIIYI